jgi:hypothetical protein
MGLGPRTGRGMGTCPCCPYIRSKMSREEKLKLLKEEKDAIEKEITSLEK